ncbi:MAG: rod shape-determining protein [Opitutaceae bacterium]|nr:rod shape-determining protein [Opitutaceae bacterium]
MLARFLKNDLALALCGDAVWLSRNPREEPVRMPAYVAVHATTRKVLAAGEEARAMWRNEPANIAVLRLLDTQSGGNDVDAWSEFLRYFLRKTARQTSIFPPRIVCVAEARMRSFLKPVVLAAGARAVMFLEPRMAAAIGCGLAVEEPAPKSILVLDRHTVSFGVIALAGLVADFVMEQGVSRLLDDIVLHVLATRRVALDVERLHGEILKRGLTGTDAIGWESWLTEIGTGRLTATSVDESDLRRLTLPFQHLLAWNHRRAFETVPLEKRVAAEAVSTVLVGPYARLPGFRELVAAALLRPVAVAEAPEACLVRGGAEVLKDLSFLLSYVTSPKSKR